MKRSPALVIGLVLNALSALSSLPTLVVPTAGPAPLVINVLTGVLGIVTLVGVVMVWRWRSGRVGLGVVLIAVSQGLNVLSAVPAFFSDISGTYKALIAVGVVLTAVAVILVLPARRAVGSGTGPRGAQPSVAR